MINLLLLLCACAGSQPGSTISTEGTLPGGLFAGGTTAAGIASKAPGSETATGSEAATGSETAPSTPVSTEPPTTAPPTTAQPAPTNYNWQTDPTSVTDLDAPLEGFDYTPYLPVPDDVSRTESGLDYLYAHGGVNHVGGGEKVIALTFSVGTEPGCTSRLLDILKEKDVQVIFLISLNEYLMSSRDDPEELVRRMVQEGHVIGSHGYTHVHSTMATNRRFINELLLYQARIDEVLRYHYPLQFFGAPYETLIERDIYLCDLMGIHFLGYSRLLADENGQAPVYMVLPQLKNSLIAGSIIQMHISEGNTDAIADFIDYAREQGYRFVLPQG